jgi:hypothetical protein
MAAGRNHFNGREQNQEKKRVAMDEICTIDGEESTGRPLSLQV